MEQISEVRLFPLHNDESKWANKVRIGHQSGISGLFQKNTPLKIHMELKHHPNEQENYLNQKTTILGFNMFNFL